MLKQSRNAMGNLINRYRAVLRACRMGNSFGSLALAATVMLTAAPPCWRPTQEEA